MNITIIGGGSYLWSFGFCKQVINSKLLKDTTITLMDINKEALAEVGKAASIFNKSKGNPVKIKLTGSLEQSLKGADFVLVSISTGGYDAMKYDISIPEKYGINHTVGDTVGPGGWMRAVRSIPVFDDIARKMKELCPDAWMINVSNPLSVLTRVPDKNHGIKTVGFCPGAENHAKRLAALAGKNGTSEISFPVTGIDHGSWFTSLFADKVDILAKLKKIGYYRSDGKLPAKVMTEDKMAVDAASWAIFAVWREIGYMPAINDRHQVENWPWYLAGKKHKIERTPISVRRKKLSQRKQDLQKYIATGDEQYSGSEGHGDDPVLQIIESLAGYSTVVYALNYKNVGQIPGFPENSVVETRCRFDAAGAQPFTSPMPDLLKTIVLPIVYRQESIIDIVLHGTFDELSALVMTDPLCSHLDVGQCRKMMKEMVLAQRKWIKNKKLLKFK